MEVKQKYVISNHDNSFHKDRKSNKGCGFYIFMTIIMIMIFYGYISSNSNENTEIVSNSAFNGSVHQVKDYIKSMARRPSSIEFLEWSDVIKNDNGTYNVRCKYSGQNGFGGYTTHNQVFTLNSSGEVIDFYDY